MPRGLLKWFVHAINVGCQLCASIGHARRGSAVFGVVFFRFACSAESWSAYKHWMSIMRHHFR